MPKIIITKTTIGYDSPNISELLPFLDDNLKASVVLEATREEIDVLRRYYGRKEPSNYGEYYQINIIVDTPTFKEHLEIARTFALEELKKEQKIAELQKKKTEKSEKTKKQNIIRKEKELFEKLKKKFESEEVCGRCNGDEKFHSTKCINFYK